MFMTIFSLIGRVSYALNNFFWEFNHYLIKFIQVGNNFLLCFSSLFIGMVVPYTNYLPLATALLIAIIAWSLVSYLLPFPNLLGKILLKEKKRKKTKKPFLTVFPTEFCFCFSYSVNNYEKNCKSFHLFFILVKAISKWDRFSSLQILYS